MLEPSLALQTAIRGALIADPAVLELVSATAIRAGSSQPAMSPTIILTDARTTFLGHGAGSQLVARVFLNLHIWALEDGQDTAKVIGGAVLRVLSSTPPPDDYYSIDEFEPPALTWLRDPNPDRAWTHGVMEPLGHHPVEAVMRSGQLNQILTVLRRSETVAPSGAVTETWEAINGVPAEVRHLGAEEAEIGPAEAGRHRAVATIRWAPGLTLEDRIVLEGRTYNVRTIVPLGRRRGLELHLVAS